MSGWAKKRFWKEATVTEDDNGFGVVLDGRVLKTPAKATLILPTRPLAEAIAAEWAAVEAEIDPAKMPCTRSANAAIDKVTPQHAEVAGLIAAYGDSDLLCYRAETPEGLIARQAETWDPYLDRAARDLGAPLEVHRGVVHCAQPADSIARLTGEVRAFTPFELTALHDLVSLSGSLVLGFAASEGWASPEEIWRASRVDETWQEEQWGIDEEAAEMAEAKRRDFLHAHRFLTLCRA
ncbi:ATP12 family chaperone protein [Actibacterium sp. XHP0104]|uniref:ATP12 family chaperone protein n=1 Tax=Actibacterium sp. XHP0104 TaxID=2984335 RepID=UPI0021E8EB37|nr:ATP12 family protein [Actibacterium sp. XHP0104]MCV2882390.1 ATPase [Actibacterium sp. XHP0104]